MHASNPSPPEWEQEDQEFEAILSYILSLRLAHATGDSVSTTKEDLYSG